MRRCHIGIASARRRQQRRRDGRLRRGQTRRLQSRVDTFAVHIEVCRERVRSPVLGQTRTFASDPPCVLEERRSIMDDCLTSQPSHFVTVGFGVEVAGQNWRHVRARIRIVQELVAITPDFFDQVVDGHDLHAAMPTVRWGRRQMRREHVDARSASVHQFPRHGLGNGILGVVGDGQCPHVMIVDLPATQNGGPKTKGWLRPLHPRNVVPTERPVIFSAALLGDPTGGVLIVDVLPHLLETHDVGVELVDPGHDLVAPLFPVRLEERANVQCHDPQHIATVDRLVGPCSRAELG
ncbi:hypothetical protein GQR58_029663 [Nymphon striatum]|nr:hypothetical protein GQR58_029663 [Nymphon striatum]